jgi:outer membrane protein
MKRFWSFCTAILVSSALLAQDGGQPFSLKQARDYALQNSYNLSNSKLDLAISEKKVQETLGAGLPQINAAGSFQNFLDIPTTVLPASAFNPNAPEGEMVGLQFGTDYTMSGSITANQLIFDGSFFVAMQAAKVYTNISRQSVEKAEIDLKNDVTQAYNTVLVAEENLKVMQATLENLKSLLAETVAIQEGGFIEELDVDQIRLTVTNMENSYNMAIRQTELAYQLLKFQMGMDMGTPITASDDLQATVDAVDMQSVVQKEFSASGSIDYQLMQSQEEMLTLGVKNTKMAYMPSLGAFFTHQQQALRNDFDFFDNLPWYPSTIWGLNLSMPIFSSGVRAAKVSQSKLELEKIQTSLKQVDQSLQFQAQAAKSDYLTAFSSYKNQQQSLALAERIQATTLIKYKNGVASSMDLTNAQNQYLSTQGNYIQSVMSLLNAKTALEKIMQP